jgi:DNA-binding NarL/FixJ family response regulator
VVLSGSGEPEDIRRSYSLGASAYFEKPTNFQELVELIRTLVAFWLRCEVPQAEPVEVPATDS